MKLNFLASSAISLAFASSLLLPLSAQATDDCDIFTNPTCELYPFPNDLYMQLPGQEVFGSEHEITLSNPQSRVAARLITPGEVTFLEIGAERHGSDIRCEVDEETYFTLGYSTPIGIYSEVVFEGKSQTVSTSKTPHGDNFLVALSFEVPQTAKLKPFSCYFTFSLSQNDGSGGSGDGYAFNLDLTRTFTPSTTAPSTTAPSTTAPSTTAPSTTAPSTTAPSTTAPSTTAPSASPSPRGTSSPTPSASAQVTDEEAEVENSSREVVVGGSAEGENEASPIGFLVVGILSTLAGIGATVAFSQRKAIIKALSKFKKIAKP
jgi:hypothetical protein